MSIKVQYSSRTTDIPDTSHAPRGRFITSNILPKATKPSIQTSFFNPQLICTMAPSAVPPSALAPLSSEAAQPSQLQVIGKTKSGKTLKIREYPKFDSLEKERLYRKQHLAAAFRVFADRGFDEGVAGHISVRDPILTDHFCTAMLVDYASQSTC
jgi:hypothetical protein